MLLFHGLYQLLDFKPENLLFVPSDIWIFWHSPYTSQFIMWIYGLPLPPPEETRPSSASVSQVSKTTHESRFFPTSRTQPPTLKSVNTKLLPTGVKFEWQSMALHQLVMCTDDSE